MILRVESLAKALENYVRDISIVWFSVEEARQMGYNVIYYVIRVKPDLSDRLPFIAFSAVYLFMQDSVDVIGIVAHLNNMSANGAEDSKLLDVLKEVGGYIYSVKGVPGILLPAYESVEEVIARFKSFVSAMWNLEVDLYIDGYILDFSSEL